MFNMTTSYPKENYKKKHTKKPIVNIVIIYCYFVLFMFVYILASEITIKNSLFLR
jgi:hypothetical protein